MCLIVGLIRGHTSTRGEGARVHAGERGTRVHAVGTGSTITRGGKDGHLSNENVHAARRRGTRLHAAGREGAALFYNPKHLHRLQKCCPHFFVKNMFNLIIVQSVPAPFYIATKNIFFH